LSANTKNCPQKIFSSKKVSQSHCPSQKQQKQYPYQQQKSFEYQPQKETNLSPNWPLQQHYRRQQLGRMGRSHDERVSIGARKESQQHSPPSPRPISQRENEKGLKFLKFHFVNFHFVKDSFRQFIQIFVKVIPSSL